MAALLHGTKGRYWRGTNACNRNMMSEEARESGEGLGGRDCEGAMQCNAMQRAVGMGKAEGSPAVENHTGI